jgi:hypothetical protein
MMRLFSFGESLCIQGTSSAYRKRILCVNHPQESRYSSLTIHPIQPTSELTECHARLILKRYDDDQREPASLISGAELERVAACSFMARAIVIGILDKATQSDLSDRDVATAELLLNAAKHFNNTLRQHRNIVPGSARPKNSFALGMLLSFHFPDLSLATARLLGDRVLAEKARAKEAKLAK